MKKLLMIIASVFFAVRGFSSVEIRVQLLNYIASLPGGTETLTVTVEAKATYAYPINLFQGSFDMGSNLGALLTYSEFQNNTYFPTPTYSQDCGVSGTAIYFKYEYASGTKTTMTIGNWNKIFDLELQYDWDGSKKTTFSWTQSTYYYTVEVIGDIGFGPIGIPVTGAQINMPAELKDRSLPVQMSSFTGQFDYERGITLKWKTQSETDCVGFHIWRSNAENGDYKPVSTSLVMANGNSSSEREYSFVDKNVTLGTKYWYKIQEISTLPDETHEIYFGGVAVATLKAPDQFAMEQNYPNPFNPDTKIVYSLPEKSSVVLKIYNILGKEVRTLINEEKQPGIYEATWNGKDEVGRMLSSGLYFYKITADDKVEIRKMMKVQ